MQVSASEGIGGEGCCAFGHALAGSSWVHCASQFVCMDMVLCKLLCMPVGVLYAAGCI